MYKAINVLLVIAVLSACGGGGSSDSEVVPKAENLQLCLVDMHVPFRCLGLRW